MPRVVSHEFFDEHLQQHSSAAKWRATRQRDKRLVEEKMTAETLRERCAFIRQITSRGGHGQRSNNERQLRVNCIACQLPRMSTSSKLDIPIYGTARERWQSKQKQHAWASKRDKNVGITKKTLRSDGGLPPATKKVFLEKQQRSRLPTAFAKKERLATSYSSMARDQV